MAVDVDIVPGPEWGRVSKDLRSASKLIEREVKEGLERAAKKARGGIRASALSTLPKTGGLAAEVAKTQVNVRATVVGNAIRVSLEANSKFNIAGLDSGSLTHPVYGNRDVWVRQAVSPRWFTEPIEKSEPEFSAEVRKAINRVINRLEK